MSQQSCAPSPTSPFSSVVPVLDILIIDIGILFFAKCCNAVVEDTNTRVLWWSIFQVVVLVSVSVFQVIYLRRFVDVKRTV